MPFVDRVEAGRRLAALLGRYRGEPIVVVALPRGGVPVGYEVARALGAPLDVCVVRKIGAPDQPELALGAVAEGGTIYLDRDLMRLVGASETEVFAAAEHKAAEVEHRVALFRGGRPPVDLRGRTVILVDDGIATGSTMRASIIAFRDRGPKKIVLATPVAASQSLDVLAPLVDDVVCIEATPYLGAIGFFYEDFTQVSDREVAQLLEQAHLGLEHPAAPPSG